MALFELQKQLPPCPVIEINEGDPDQVNKDVITHFDLERAHPENKNYVPGLYLTILHCQLHFSYFRHDLLDESQRQCPYYSVCGSPFRVDHPEMCKNDPWKHYSPVGETCWYGSGISSLFNIIRI